MNCQHECRECAIPTHTKKMRDVASAVAAYYELLDFGDRDQVSSRARAVAAWLLCEQFSRARLSTIANVLGYKDRTGVGHAITRIEGLMPSDRNLQNDISTLRGLVAA